MRLVTIKMALSNVAKKARDTLTLPNIQLYLLHKLVRTVFWFRKAS